MTPPKKVTNADIYAKLQSFDGRLLNLEKWKHEVEFAKEVIKEYQKEHPVDEEKGSPNSNAWKAVVAALAAVTAALLAR